MPRGKPEPSAPEGSAPGERSQTEQPPQLPPGLDLLWGRRGHGRRGPRPALSLEAIIGAAVQLADAEGLEAVSMARVAELLGFTTMSLYRYVATKDELLQLMWNASALVTQQPDLDGRDWRERLRKWALAQRDVIDQHPWMTQMPMAAPPLAPNSLAFVERGLETLDGTGLADRDKLRVIGLLSSYTLSEARMAYDAVRATEQAKAHSRGPASPWTFEALLRELIEEQRYPRLHRIAWSADAQEEMATPGDERAEFLFGIELILDGVQTLVRRAQQATD
jgi:AcrR family transcriptional regulator